MPDDTPVSQTPDVRLRGVLSCIRAHAEALRSYDATYDALEAAEAAEENWPEIHVLLGVRPSGARAGFLELGPMKVDECREAIRRFHERRRALFNDPWIRELCSFQLADIAAALSRSEELAMASLLEGIEREKAHLAAAGVAAAREAVDAARQRERNTRIALLLARPTDDIEANAKAEYIASSDPFTEKWHEEDGDAIVEYLIRAHSVIDADAAA